MGTPSFIWSDVDGDIVMWLFSQVTGRENRELERLGNISKPGTGGGLASVSRLSFPCPWPQRSQTLGGCHKIAG